MMWKMAAIIKKEIHVSVLYILYAAEKYSFLVHIEILNQLNIFINIFVNTVSTFYNCEKLRLLYLYVDDC